MAASTLTPGSVLMEGICLTISEGLCGPTSHFWILIWNQSQVLEWSPQGVFLVVILRVLGGIQTGPFTLRFFSFMPLIRSAHTFFRDFTLKLVRVILQELRTGLPGGSVVKNPPTMQETRVRSPGWEDPLEKGMATLSSILAREIPWREEPSGLMESMESLRVRLSWACTLGVFIWIPLDIICFIIEEKYIFHFLPELLVNNPPAMREAPVQFLGWEDPLKKG